MNRQSNLRVGVVASSSGSVFNALVEIMRDRPVEWTLVTDRPCKSEDVAVRHAIAMWRIETRDNREFSAGAAAAFEKAGVEVVLLFFLRLVTAEIFEKFQTYNLHPSLLPAFSGFGAVRRARASGARLLGATAHFVTEAVDGGPILAQTADPMNPSAPEAAWQRMSFRQKVRLGAWLLDALLAGKIACESARGLVQVSALTQAGPPMIAEFIDHGLGEAVDAWIAANAEPLHAEAGR